jgi:hypothetical protein
MPSAVYSNIRYEIHQGKLLFIDSRPLRSEGKAKEAAALQAFF